MKKTTLKDLIYNRILKASFAMVIVIIAIFLLVYFGMTSYMTGEMIGTIRQNVVQETVQSVKRETEIISGKIDEINQLMYLLQSEHEQFYKLYNSYPKPRESVSFKVHENGAYYKSSDNGGSAFYYSADTPLDDYAVNKALLSEYLDPSFKKMVESNPLITQVYINTYDNMNRIYPYREDLASLYGATFKMEDYNFYYLADLKHNPAKEPVWTSAYLDPAGQGWMVSCVVPIYNGGKLEGVTGVDMTLDVMIDKVLDLRLPVESAIFVTDEQGVILAMTEEVEAIFNLEELQEHEYSEVVEGTVYKPEIFRLDQQKSDFVGSRLQGMLNEKSETMIIEIEHEMYHVIKNEISGSDWHLFVMVNQEELLAPVYKIEDQVSFLSMIVFIMVFVLFAIFYIYFIRKSSELTSKICDPIVSLTHMTSQLGQTKNLQDLPEESEILEIDALTYQYQKMVEDLEVRTEALVNKELESKMQEQMAQLYKRQAHVDELTQVFNRRRIDDILEQEINRASRYNQDLSVILVDIDHFKNVNDQYGHDVGDEVLMDFSALLREQSRTTDFIARWGGEEFLIVCPHTDVNGAVILAEKLRVAIETFKFTTDEKQTASFGVVQYSYGNNKRLLLKRVDTAMYEAKSQSRNCVVSYKN